MCPPITIVMYGVATAAVASFAKTSTLYAVIALVLAAGTVALLVISIRHVRKDKDNGMR